jgi:hypothetical protein
LDEKSSRLVALAGRERFLSKEGACGPFLAKISSSPGIITWKRVKFAPGEGRVGVNSIPGILLVSYYI